MKKIKIKTTAHVKKLQYHGQAFGYCLKYLTTVYNPFKTIEIKTQTETE